MYMEETWILSNKNKTEEGQVIEIRDSIGRGLKRAPNSRGMNLKVKHKVGPHLFPKFCKVFPPKFSSRETIANNSPLT